MNKSHLSSINGELCPDFFPNTILPSISMREVYSTCKNCIEYEKGSCLKDAYSYITIINRN